MHFRILIVDDDKSLRRIIETYIKADDAIAAKHPEIVSAQDGKEGLAALEKGAFDLIVTDLLMPRMDGFQFCREVRTHAATKNIPIVVTSAVFKDKAAIENLSELGVGFVPKPFSGQELLSEIRKVLKAASMNAPRSATPVPEKKAAPAPQPTQEGFASSSATGGALADRSTSRLLLDLWEQQLTGILLLQRGQIKKEISLIEGKPVNVNSNVRTEVLGQFLITRGVLDEKQHQTALVRSQETRAKYGGVLVELGWITERDLLFQLAAQMRMKIANTLRWKDGTWTFANTEAAGGHMQFPIDAPRLVFAGLKKSAKVGQVAEAFSKGQWRVNLSPRIVKHKDAYVRVFGVEGLAVLGKSPTIESLTGRPDRNDLLVQLDVLGNCGLVELDAEEAGNEASIDPIALEEISTKNAPTEIGSLYDELFGGQPTDSLPRNAPQNLQAVVPAQTVAAPRFEDSGLLSLPGPDGAAAASPTPTRAESQKEARKLEAIEALRKDINRWYLDIYQKDLFQVLRVPTDASLEDIAAAYGDLGARFPLDTFTAEELGGDYHSRLVELHEVFKEAYETLSSRDKRVHYRQTLSAREMSSSVMPSAIDAELLVQEATDLLTRGDARGARQRLEEVVTSVTDQADYHALLGWAVFIDEGGESKDPSQARAAASIAWLSLEQAFQVDADNVAAHEAAGRIFAAAGDVERAIKHLETTLDQDPSRAEAFEALVTQLERMENYQRLEHLYRKMIHALGSAGEPARQFSVWWRLYGLYRDQLKDERSAEIALQVAARLQPEDPHVIAALKARAPVASANAAPEPEEDVRRSPTRKLPVLVLPNESAEPKSIEFTDNELPRSVDADWFSKSEGLVSSWRVDPSELNYGRELFRVYMQAQRWDSAYLAAGVLVCRGETSSEATKFFTRHRPRFVVRAQNRFSPEMFERVRHPDDAQHLSELFRLVFAAFAPVYSLASLGVSAQDRVAVESLAEPFDTLSRYCAHVMQVDVPYVYRRDDLAEAVQIGAAQPPVLLATNDALHETERRDLTFAVGRALSYLLPGRALASSIRSEHLKQYLLAAITLLRPSLEVEDAGGEIAALRDRYVDNLPDFPLKAAPLVERILQSSQGRLNLSQYVRGMARTADRIGLILCNDIVAAYNGLASQAPNVRDDLCDFALTPEYATLREELGLSIAV